MSANATGRPAKYEVLLLVAALPLLAGCSRAPSVDVLGSFFPAWLVCVIVSILLTALVRLALVRLHMKIAFPILVYPSLVAFLTFALWLIFFH